MTSELHVPDPEELLVCPYDKVHMVRAKRFQYHLMKCRKNWPGSEYAVCPFNAKHEMPKPELRYHMANCSDRSVLEKDIAFERSMAGDVEGTLFKGCTDVPAYNQNSHLTSDENWDRDMNSNPRIGVDPEFFDKFKYIDLSGYTNASKKAMYENLKAEFDGQVVKKPNANKNPAGVGKLRLPQNESKASKLTEFRGPVKHQPNVFAYSLSMAGLGRGKAKDVSAHPQYPVGRGIFNLGLGRGTASVGIRELIGESRDGRLKASGTKPTAQTGAGEDVVLLRNDGTYENADDAAVPSNAGAIKIQA